MAAANLVGPANLVEAMQARGRDTGSARPCRLVHLGSAAEYGRVPVGTATTEDDPERPLGVYGATKLGATRLVRAAALAGLDAVVLRLANPIGPGSPATSLAGRIAGELRAALKSGQDVTTGPLDDVRDFVDVRDVAAAVVAAAVRRSGSLPPVLNVGSGVGTRVAAVVDGLVAVSGFTGAVRVATDGSPRSSAVPWQQADIGLIGSTLGWRPERDLDTALRDLWHASLVTA
jgi:nucleoside-diphosphate-sugar epimerase